jgi:hypothetical protein
MNPAVRPHDHLIRDARADWRRWSAGERVAACALAALLGGSGPALFVVLMLSWPM